MKLYKFVHELLRKCSRKYVRPSSKSYTYFSLGEGSFSLGGGGGGLYKGVSVDAPLTADGNKKKYKPAYHHRHHMPIGGRGSTFLTHARTHTHTHARSYICQVATTLAILTNTTSPVRHPTIPASPPPGIALHHRKNC